MTKYTIETEKPRIMAAYMAIDNLLNNRKVTDDLVRLIDDLCSRFTDILNGDNEVTDHLVERDLEYMLTSCQALVEAIRGEGVKARNEEDDE